jgi:hypothetical protein
MLRQLLQVSDTKDVVKRLKRNLYLRKVCGYGDKAPIEARTAGELGASIIAADKEDGEKARGGVLLISKKGRTKCGLLDMVFFLPSRQLARLTFYLWIRVTM